MDPITQGLLGATTAQLGFRQKLGRGATWAATITALLPDLDVFVAPTMRAMHLAVGPFASMRYHRGLSHSLLMMPALAAGTAGLWHLFSRKRFRWQYLCCLVAAASHPLLDWCTSYGTQLLAPLTDRRYAIDAVPIVDILYTPLLILTLLGCWAARRFGRRPGRTDLRVAWTGLALSVAYLATGWLMHEVAVRRGLQAYRNARADAVSHAPPGKLQAHAYPALGSIFVWRVVLHDDAGWYVGRTHTLFDRPVRLTRYDDDDDPFVRAAYADERVATFAWFADGQVRAVRKTVGGAAVVELHDMRYGITPGDGRSLWYAQVAYRPDGTIQTVQRRHTGRADGRRTGRLRSAAGAAWRELFTP